jgi:transposase-like protein
MQIQLHKILDVAKCYEILRSVRWESGLICTQCSSNNIVKNGKDALNTHLQHYKCKSCGIYFDDLTDTIFSGSHYGIDKWITILYLMNLNVSNLQIAHELDINEDTIASMCAKIREGVVKKKLILALAQKLRLTNVM